MELFAAATGCTDPRVASLFLERAGNNVEIAVNHFLDAPNAAHGGESLNGKSSTTTNSPTRGAKRPRSSKVSQETQGHQQQQLLGVGSKGPRQRDTTETVCRGREKVGREASPVDDAAYITPRLSAEWREIADRCRR